MECNIRYKITVFNSALTPQLMLEALHVGKLKRESFCLCTWVEFNLHFCVNRKALTNNIDYLSYLNYCITVILTVIVELTLWRHKS